ncbi:MAG: class I SAM-dependent methyltransferase [Zetaproteobacteria bacterium]|nr:class I SAM-dependent methyltransferase [Zetaproteobacteria bacterium]
MVPSTFYQLLDSGHGRKLEQFGPVRLIRPSAQALWRPQQSAQMWKSSAAEFVRKSDGHGKWCVSPGCKLPQEWKMQVSAQVSVLVRPTDFGHLGLFPEHHGQKALQSAVVGLRNRGCAQVRILNLFGYTGIPTLELAAAGAHLTHVDASKASVQWAKENQQLSGLQDAPVRWIVDDVGKYVARLVRRQEKFSGILLDPPSFGRGTKNEVWKIEEHLLSLLEQLAQLIDWDHFAFFQLSAHSQSTSAEVLSRLLAQGLSRPVERIHRGEMVVRAATSGTWDLPCGAYARLTEAEHK